jgi:hypothetical protein
MTEELTKLDAPATLKVLHSLGIPRLYMRNFEGIVLNKADSKKLQGILDSINEFVNDGLSVVMIYEDSTQSGCVATRILYEIAAQRWAELYYITPGALASTKVEGWGEGGLWNTYTKASAVFLDGVSNRMNSLESTSMNDFLEYRLYNYYTTLLAIDRDARDTLSDRVISALKPKYGVTQFGWEARR